MEDFYGEILEREGFLMGQEQTEEVKSRLSEIRLTIVRVQQILLKKL